MAKILTLVPDETTFWLKLFAWGFLIIFAAKFILMDALPYYGLDEEIYGRFCKVKWTLLGHVFISFFNTGYDTQPMVGFHLGAFGTYSLDEEMAIRPELYFFCRGK